MFKIPQKVGGFFYALRIFFYELINDKIQTYKMQCRMYYMYSIKSTNIIESKKIKKEDISPLQL